jgi:hypothetical protein
MYKRVLITGCGRSGTKYISILLGRCGLEIVHERRMGKDGISSWLFGAESSTAPWGPSPADYSFEHTFHLIRNPLSAIPSIATFSRAAWKYISGHISIEASDSPILRSAKYWLYWNGMVENKTDIRLKIEDMPGAIAILCDRVGAQLDISSIKQVPNDLNTRRYGNLFNIFECTCLDVGLVRNIAFLKKLLSKIPPMYDDLTWKDLGALDLSLAEKIYAKALKYGYNSPTSGAGIHA